MHTSGECSPEIVLTVSLRSPWAISIAIAFVLDTCADMGIYLLSGDDESVLRTAVRELLNELVADNDSSMMVDEFDDAEFSMQSVVDAAHTPPFLTDRRVVVARNVGRFSLADLLPLLSFLENPLDSTDVVLVGGGELGFEHVGRVQSAPVNRSSSDNRVHSNNHASKYRRHMHLCSSKGNNSTKPP